MSELSAYYYDKQLRAYIVQFAAIFAGIQVKVGKRKDIEAHLISVPIKNASSSRVVASIIGDNTQNKLLRLPIMSFQLMGLDMAPELRKGIAYERRQTYMPTGGLYPDDFSVVQQRMPVPYRATFELGIWTSNQDQHYQIMEQLLMLFDPILQVQINDETFDPSMITTVELTDIRFEENIPAGGERRLIQSTLSFAVPVHMAIPADVHKRFIKEIYIRIGAVDTDTTNSYDIISDLDSQGIKYDKVVDANDADIK